MLSVKNIHFKYDQHDVLNHVNLEVHEGELFCLLGQSGCGKSTLLRLIAGLETLQEGEIHIQNTMVSSNKKSISPDKRDIGFVFQDGALFPHITIAKQITLASRLKKKRERTHELAEMLKISHVLDAYPHEMSGGEQQRASIARALATEPKLLLMDEPFSSLDAVLRKQIGEELKELLRDLNITTIFVTHDQKEAICLADRLALMEGGQLLQVGQPEALYENPQKREVAEFIGEGIFLDAELISENEVKTSLGTISIKNPEELRVGSAVQVFIRPNWLECIGEKQGYECRVEKSYFEGNLQKYVLKDEQQNKILYENIYGEKALEVQQSYRFHLNREAIIFARKN